MAGLGHPLRKASLLACGDISSGLAATPLLWRIGGRLSELSRLEVLSGWPFAHHADRSHKHCGDVESPWPARRKCKSEKKKLVVSLMAMILSLRCASKQKLPGYLPSTYLSKQFRISQPLYAFSVDPLTFSFVYLKKKKNTT